MKSFSLLLLTLFCMTMSVLVSPQAPSTTHAAQEHSKGLRTTTQADGVLLEWERGSTTAATASSLQALDIADWPLVEIGGWQLPARLVPLRITDGALLQSSTTPTIALQAVESIAWTGTVQPAAPPTPQTIDGEERPALAPAPARTQTLPSAPVVLLREGRMRGEHIIVVAVMPIFAQQGALRVATHVQALIPGTALLDGQPESDAMEHAWRVGHTQQTDLSESVQPWGVAARSALRITVERGGIQRITGATLSDAGLDLPTLDPALLHLWYNGSEVALEVWGTDDGTLDSSDELRFYAPAPGDRWNATDTYWLTIEETPGVRMPQRDATPGSATAQSTVFERGEWRDNRLYDSNLPGPDKDHWFSADLRTNPTQVRQDQDASQFDITLTALLPSVAGTTTLTVMGSAYTPGAHQLVIQMGEASDEVAWSGIGDWSHTVVFTTTWQPDIRISLQPGDLPSGILLDSVVWQRPALLDATGRGATFTGRPGTWRYTISRFPQGGTLYDVSTPTLPVRLTLPDATTVEFEDGPTVRAYIVAAAGTLHTPTVVPHTPINLATPMQAEALYIAPTPFHATLEPLVQLRREQGYRVAVVNVQAIYDTWSYGQVDPDALRNFLRYAAATWDTAPIAVTFVGDGTSDPFNYAGYETTNVIPPYMAQVDPWIGETACETCYVQLDGDNPLSDTLPDMHAGRLPVNSVQELETVVAKIVAYETNQAREAWQSRVVYVTDNFREASGQVDGAGNFHAFADGSATLQPLGIHIDRLYYDPSSSYGQTSWVEADAISARQRTMAMFSSGAAIVNYVGHSFYWQWAVTDAAAERPYLLGVYDIATLTNGRRLPVVLEMTCLTGGFQRPVDTGKSIDEQMLLHPGGGAVAVWGSSGFGVEYGHEWLQQGFYRALWDDGSSVSKPLGELTSAGYLELFTNGGCCYDAIQTYLLIGDPLTVPNVSAEGLNYLPLISD